MKNLNMTLRARKAVALCCLSVLVIPTDTRQAFADDAASKTASLEAVRAKAVQFLKLTQSTDGTWTTANVPGITALCVTSLLQSGVPADDPSVARG